MNVKELRGALDDLPDDMEVVVEKDDGYSPLDSVNSSIFCVAEEPWWGRLYSLNWTADEACMEEEEWEEVKKKPRSLLLCPVN